MIWNMLANKLTLNKDKTEYMIAGSRQRISKIENDPEVKLRNCYIKRVRDHRNDSTNESFYTTVHINFSL